MLTKNCRPLQRLWDASGDFWQAQWDKILNKFGDDPMTLWVYGKLKKELSLFRNSKIVTNPYCTFYTIKKNK